MKMTASSKPKPEGTTQAMGPMYALSFAYNIVQVLFLNSC